MAKGYTYILKCAGGKYYVGSTTDLDRRMKEHQSGIGGAKFTKAHLPVELAYFEEYETYEDAYNRENQLHKWSRKKKEALIDGSLIRQEK